MRARTEVLRCAVPLWMAVVAASSPAKTTMDAAQDHAAPVRCTIAPSADPAPGGLVLWYEQPASKWTEALPVGNGRIGAMVFGGVVRERIQLNECSVWQGRRGSRPVPDSASSLASIRRMLFEGRYKEGQAAAARELLCDAIEDSYQTLGDLLIESPLATDASEYRRGLDIGTCTAVTSWVDRGFRSTRTVFASRAAPALVVRQHTEEPAGLFVRIALRRERSCDACEQTTMASVDGGRARIRLRGATASDAGSGVRFAADAIINCEGGSIAVDGDGIAVRAANAVTITLVAATDFPFVGAGAAGAMKSLRAGADPARPDPDSLIAASAAASAMPFSKLQSDHEAAWKRDFNRLEVEFGPPAVELEKLPTDQRLRRVGEGAVDPGLAALYVQFARMLLLASSVAGGLPSNLQGIWSEHLHAPWNADYHLNINLQMNYWPAEVLHLPSTVAPLTDFVERLALDGAVTARRMYGASGWMAHHCTDAWAWTVPSHRTTVWSLWPHGGGWISQTIHDHWDFGRDPRYLREQAFPLVRGCAAFYLDWLCEDPDRHDLVGGPSASPENAFLLPDGSAADTAMGNAMDQMIAFDVLRNFLEEARALGIAASDDPLVSRAEETLKRLRAPQIGSDGRLLEWAEPWPEAEPGHRHMSHLFALHPGRQITPQDHPQLAAAARKSLDERLRHGGGHTGWSRAWLMLFFARLQEGQRAFENLQQLLARSTLPNLFDDHPPFQIDGNFGAAAGIAEMLVQSHREVAGDSRSQDSGSGHVIALLPALPAEWSRGSVRGLRARGAVEIDIMWSERRLLFAVLRASGQEPLRIAWPGDAPAPIVTRIADNEALECKHNGDWIQVAPAGVAGSYRIAPAR